MTTNLSIGAGAVSAAYTTFVEKYAELYAGQYPGVYQLYTENIPVTTKKLDLNWLANHPVMSKWLGARVEKSLRHYGFSMEVEPYEATLALKRLDVTADRIGFVGRSIDTFLRNNLVAYDKAAADSLASNSGKGPTCYDGVNLIDDDHVHVDNVTNHSTNSLSHANLVTAEQTMSLLLFEQDEPAQIMADTVLVGPKLKRRAMELLQSSNRVVMVDNDGNLDSPGTDDVVSVTGINNVWQGDLKLVVDTRITNFYWYVFDTSKAGAKPLILAEFRKPQPYVRDQMTDPRRWEHDDFLYGLEGDFTVTAGHWMTINGNLGTA